MTLSWICTSIISSSVVVFYDYYYYWKAFCCIISYCIYILFSYLLLLTQQNVNGFVVKAEQVKAECKHILLIIWSSILNVKCNGDIQYFEVPPANTVDLHVQIRAEREFTYLLYLGFSVLVEVFQGAKSCFDVTIYLLDLTGSILASVTLRF